MILETWSLQEPSFGVIIPVRSCPPDEYVIGCKADCGFALAEQTQKQSILLNYVVTIFYKISFCAARVLSL